MANILREGAVPIVPLFTEWDNTIESCMLIGHVIDSKEIIHHTIGSLFAKRLFLGFGKAKNKAYFFAIFGIGSCK